MRPRSTLHGVAAGIGTLLVAVLLFTTGASRASAADPTFQWLYGGNSYDIFYGMTTTADGGFLAVGVSGSFNGSDNDVYVVRTDACGVLKWSATYDIGHGGHDEARKVVRGLDGGYVIVGTLQNIASCGATGHDAFVMKIDDAGNVIWAKSYAGLDNDFGNDIAAYGNSGYVISGFTASFGAGDLDGFLMRVDLTGNPVYARTYGALSSEVFNSVAVAANGDVIAAGSTLSYTNDSYNQIYVVRTNPDLTLQWSYHFGGDSTIEEANDVVAMTDGSIAVLGHSSKLSPFFFEQPYLLKLSSTGSCICDAIFAAADSNLGQFTEAKELVNGELAVTGFYFNQIAGLGRFDVLLMRINAKCQKVSAEEYGIDWRDQGHSLVPIYSNGVLLPTGYVIAGSTNSFNGGGFDDAYLIRTDRNGLSGCHEYTTVIAQKSPGFCAQKAPTTVGLMLVATCVSTGPDFNTESELICKKCAVLQFEDANGGLLSRRAGDPEGGVPEGGLREGGAREAGVPTGGDRFASPAAARDARGSVPQR